MNFHSFQFSSDPLSRPSAFWTRFLYYTLPNRHLGQEASQYKTDGIAVVFSSLIVKAPVTMSSAAKAINARRQALAKMPAAELWTSE